MQNAPPRKRGCHLASDIVGSNPTSPTKMVRWFYGSPMRTIQKPYGAVSAPICWRSSRRIEQRICTPYVAGLSPAVSSTNRVCTFFPGWLLCIAGAGLWLDLSSRHITHVAVALARFIAGAWGKQHGCEAGMISLSEDGSIPSKRGSIPAFLQDGTVRFRGGDGFLAFLSHRPNA